MKDNYSAWQIQENDFPTNGSTSDQIHFLLGYAILAPSTHNAQPWLFEIDGDVCKIYLDESKRLPEADPTGRDAWISIGCMLENLLIAARHFSFEPEITWYTAGSHIATLKFGKQDDSTTNESLLSVIPHRWNARGFFLEKSIPDSILSELEKIPRSYQGIELSCIQDTGAVDKIARLTAAGVKEAQGTRAFRREFASYFHSNITKKYTGIPGFAVTLPLIPSFILPKLLMVADLSPVLSKINYKSVKNAPLVCVLSSSDDSPRTWVEVGRTAQRCMLELNAQELRTSVYVASVEIGEYYKDLQVITGLDARPQFLFIAGYMDTEEKHTPRIPVSDLFKS